VAAEADSAVDKHTAARRLEMLEHFGDHDGLMLAHGSWLKAHARTFFHEP
jgi:hypothetical protein